MAAAAASLARSAEADAAPRPAAAPLRPRGTRDAISPVQRLDAIGQALGARPAVAAQRRLAGRLAGIAQLHPVVQRGGAGSKADENEILQTEYQKEVAKAVTLLQDKISFGTSPEDHYDKANWEQIPDQDFKLAIRTKVKPSTALKALGKASKGVWSFDCAEFVQVCNLFAGMEVYGDEFVDKKGPLVLRQHKSSVFNGGGYTFERKEKGAKFDVIDHGRKNAYVEKYITEAELLSNIPAGTRVCFKNPAAPETPFRNENAIALGGGRYAAHPMGTNLTAEQIVAKLVDYNKESQLGGESGGADLIFVSQIEVYSLLPRTNAVSDALKLPHWN